VWHRLVELGISGRLADLIDAVKQQTQALYDLREALAPVS
jgi:hypothetical protein